MTVTARSCGFTGSIVPATGLRMKQVLSGALQILVAG
jgi:hypothetical protein